MPPVHFGIPVPRSLGAAVAQRLALLVHAATEAAVHGHVLIRISPRAVPRVRKALEAAPRLVDDQ